jgi:hypothetical protein
VTALASHDGGLIDENKTECAKGFGASSVLFQLCLWTQDKKTKKNWKLAISAIADMKLSFKTSATLPR